MITFLHQFLRKMFPRRASRIVDVSVVIPCHNYGQYLSRAIESVLRQTLKPHEILVIDDASSDDTKNVALSYVSKGVSYLRVEHRDLSMTRNAGTRHTHGSFVLFLDADDYLADDYIEKCYEACTDNCVGFSYGDVQKFGDSDVFRRSPDFDPALLSRSNYICSHALIRRDALVLSKGYRSIPHIMEDWDFYRRAVSLGFIGKRADTKSFYFIHADSMLQKHKASSHFTYCNDAAIFFNPVTIGIIAEEATETATSSILNELSNMRFDPALIHLHVCTVLPNSTVDSALRSSLMNLPFRSIQHSSVHAEQQDMRIRLACTRIVLECNTEYLWMRSAHVSLPRDALQQLLTAMDPHTVAVVFKTGDGIESSSERGFDCTLFRIHPLRSVLSAPMNIAGDEGISFEESLLLRLREYGKICVTQLSCKEKCCLTEAFAVIV